MDGAVVRAFASHQCVPGSIPGLGVICGLSLLLVLFLALRGFSSGTPVFSSLQKSTFPNSNSIWNCQALCHEPLARMNAQALPVLDIKFAFTFFLPLSNVNYPVLVLTSFLSLLETVVLGSARTHYMGKLILLFSEQIAPSWRYICADPRTCRRFSIAWMLFLCRMSGTRYIKDSSVKQESNLDKHTISGCKKHTCWLKRTLRSGGVVLGIGFWDSEGVLSLLS